MALIPDILTQAGRSKFTAAIESVLFLGGLLSFIWFPLHSHFSVLRMLPCLIVPALVVGKHIRSVRDFFTVFDIRSVTRKTVLYLPVASLTGLLLGMLYREYIHLPVFPSRMTSFALTAAVIGTVEELLFRGFLQAQLRKINAAASVVMATAAHTTYKVTLFAALQGVFNTNLIFLLIWTFLSGLIFGVIKEYSRNVIFPATGHVVFDLVVYGGSTLTPWWVW
jgi:membrane protease YdiL (CAAX protease family)